MDHHYLARDLLFQLGQENKNSCSSSPSLPGYLPYLTIVSSCLSMLGCLLIILTFIIWKELRTTARAIVVFLSIADFFTAAGYCMAASVYIHFSGNSPRTLCRVQSFITSAFPTSSFLWTMHLAIYLFVAIVLDKPLLAKKLVILFHITGWGIPLAIDIPALATHHLGASHSQTSVDWCFVTFNYTNPNSTSEFHRRLAEYYSFELLCGKFWEITAYVVALSLYISIKVALKRRQRSVAVIQDSDSVTYGSLVIKKKMETAMVHLDRKLIFIPLVFILLRIWGTLRFFISFMSSCHHRCGTEIVVINPCKRALYDRFLLTMHAIGDPAQGWGNAIIFALFNRTISRRLFPCVYFLGRKIRHCFTKHSAGDTQSFMHGIKDPLLHNSDEQM